MNGFLQFNCHLSPIRSTRRGTSVYFEMAYKILSNIFQAAVIKFDRKEKTSLKTSQLLTAFLMDGIYNLSSAISRYYLLSEEEIRFDTNTFTVYLKSYRLDYLPNRFVNFSLETAYGLYSLNMPHRALRKYLFDRNEEFTFEMVVFEDNPFYYEHNVSFSTPSVSLNIYRNGRRLDVYNTSQYIQIHMPVMKDLTAFNYTSVRIHSNTSSFIYLKLTNFQQNQYSMLLSIEYEQVDKSLQDGVYGVTIIMLCSGNKSTVPNQIIIRDYSHCFELFVNRMSFSIRYELPLNLTLPYLLLRSNDVFIVFMYTSFDRVELIFQALFYEFTCYYLRNFSTVWETYNCKVIKSPGSSSSSSSSTTDQQRLGCQCNHLSVFKGRADDLAVGEKYAEKIRLENIFDPQQNQNGIYVIVTINFCFVLLMVWARSRDKKDSLLALPIDLADNSTTAKFVYLLAVTTGSRINASSSAMVFVCIIGDEGTSAPHHLTNRKFAVLRRGQQNFFLIRVTRSLGIISALRFWHRNEGKKPDWFLSKAVLTDLQSRERYYFRCSSWLSSKYGMTADLTFFAASKNEQNDFKSLLTTNALVALVDKHTWLSIFFKPILSPFTRVQRVLLCAVIMHGILFCNLLFFERSNNFRERSPEPTSGQRPDENSNRVSDIGGESHFSLKSLLTGLWSTIIMVPISVTLTWMFEKTKLKTVGSALIQSNWNRPEPKSRAVSYESFNTDSLKSFETASIAFLEPFPEELSSVNRRGYDRKVNTTKNRSNNNFISTYLYGNSTIKDKQTGSNSIKGGNDRFCNNSTINEKQTRKSNFIEGKRYRFNNSFDEYEKNNRKYNDANERHDLQTVFNICNSNPKEKNLDKNSKVLTETNLFRSLHQSRYFFKSLQTSNYSFRGNINLNRNDAVDKILSKRSTLNESIVKNRENSLLEKIDRQSVDPSSLSKIPKINSKKTNSETSIAMTNSSDDLTMPLESDGENVSGEILPSWCRHIAWILSLVLIATFAFFVIHFIGKLDTFGVQVLVLSVLTSFIFSLFVEDTIKVALFAMVYSILFRKDMERTLSRLDEIRRQAISGLDNVTDKDRERVKNLRSDAKYTPPDNQVKISAREQILYSKGIKRIFYKFLRYFIALLVLLLSSILFKRQDTYFVTDGMNRQLFENQEFQHIWEKGDFWTWMRMHFVTYLYPEKKILQNITSSFYPNDPEDRITASGHLYLMATPCLVRIFEQMVYEEVIEEIIGPKKASSESICLGYNKYLALSNIEQMEASNWINRKVTTIGFELVLYSPTADLLVAIIVILSIPEGLGITMQKELYSLAFQRISRDDYKMVLTLVFILFVVLIFSFYTIRTLLYLGVEGFFNSLWNLIDLTIVGMLMALIVYYCIYMEEMRLSVLSFMDNKKINHRGLKKYSDITFTLFNFITALTLIKAVALFRFSEMLNGFMISVRRSLVLMLGFFIFSFTIILGFAILLNLNIGPYAWTFKSIEFGAQSIAGYFINGGIPQSRLIFYDYSVICFYMCLILFIFRISMYNLSSGIIYGHFKEMRCFSTMSDDKIHLMTWWRNFKAYFFNSFNENDEENKTRKRTDNLKIRHSDLMIKRQKPNYKRISDYRSNSLKEGKISKRR